MKYIQMLAAISLIWMGLPSSAQAYTECQANVKWIWAGDSGHVWIYLTTGKAAIIAQTDPNREAALALATTAMVSNRIVSLRFAADNVDCTVAEARSDFVGLFLL